MLMLLVNLKNYYSAREERISSLYDVLVRGTFTSESIAFQYVRALISHTF